MATSREFEGDRAVFRMAMICKDDAAATKAMGPMKEPTPEFMRTEKRRSGSTVFWEISMPQDKAK